MKKILLLIRFYYFKKELDDQFIKEKKTPAPLKMVLLKIYVCLLSKYIQKEYFMKTNHLKKKLNYFMKESSPTRKNKKRMSKLIALTNYDSDNIRVFLESDD